MLKQQTNESEKTVNSFYNKSVKVWFKSDSKYMNEWESRTVLENHFGQWLLLLMVQLSFGGTISPLVLSWNKILVSSMEEAAEIMSVCGFLRSQYG